MVESYIAAGEPETHNCDDEYIESNDANNEECAADEDCSEGDAKWRIIFRNECIEFKGEVR